MPTFLYNGIDKDSNEVAGSRHFPKKSDMDNYVESLELQRYNIFESITPYSKNRKKYISDKELSTLCKQFSVLFISDFTITEGVLMLSEQVNNRALKKTLVEIHSFMMKGYTFAESISMYEHIFGKYLVSMTIIGEKSGMLDKVFEELSDYFNREYSFKKRFKSSLTYPLILSGIMLFIIIVLILKVLPVFGNILNKYGAQTNNITNMILKTNTFVSEYAFGIMIGIVVIAIAFMIYSRTDFGNKRLQKLEITLPVFRYINKRIYAAKFMRSLSMLLHSGIDLVSSIELAMLVIDNKYLYDKYDVALKNVRNGNKLSESFAEVDVFPELYQNMIVIGESTGQLDEMMSKTASLIEDDVEDSLNQIVVYIEPILIIILSAVICAVLLSVALPMVDIMKSIV